MDTWTRGDICCHDARHVGGQGRDGDLDQGLDVIEVVLQQQRDQILGVETGVDNAEVKLDPEKLSGVDLTISLPVQEVVLIIDDTLTRVIVCHHPHCGKKIFVCMAKAKGFQVASTSVFTDDHLNENASTDVDNL